MGQARGSLTRSSIAGVAVLLLCMLASWLGADRAGALVVRLPNGHTVGITLHAGVSAASIPGVRPRVAPAIADNGNMVYNGGPVLHSSAPYLIFWDPSSTIPSSTKALLELYFSDVARDSRMPTNEYSVLRQYSDQTGIADYAQTFSSSNQAIPDTTSYPTRDPSCPAVNLTTCLTDAQLQAELTSVISSHHLPTDGATSASGLVSRAPTYFIVTPPDVNICLTSSLCANTKNGFCSYHRYFVDAGGNYVLYASIPLLGAENTSVNPKNCQSDGNPPIQEPNSNGSDAGDVAISYLAHENAETITDPLLNAWYDSTTSPQCTTSPSCNEVGDNCAFYGATADPINGFSPDAFAPPLGGSAAPVPPARTGTLYNQLINGDSYYAQSMWSNGDVNCQLQPSTSRPIPSFAVPSGNQLVGSPVSFDPSASETFSSAGYSSVAWSFGDGASSFVSTATTGVPAPATVAHAYAASGTYTVTLTLVDAAGSLGVTTGTVTVRSAPSSSFTAAPANPVVATPVSFDGSGSADANSDGSISSYSWSFGDGTAGSGPAPSHTYSAAGVYTVTLTVTNNFGFISSPSVVNLRVLALPKAAFTFSPRSPLSGHPVAFDGVAADPNNSGSIHYRWSFGDGATGSGDTASHTYARPGSYTAKLKVTDGLGASASTSHVVVVTRPGKPLVSHGSLSGVGTGKPRLTFGLAAGTKAPGLEKVAIGLPAGLSFSKVALAKGLSVKGAIRFTAKLSHGKLTITLHGAARTIRVRIAPPAIKVTVALAHTFNHHRMKAVKIFLTVVDAGGTQTRLMPALRLRA